MSYTNISTSTVDAALKYVDGFIDSQKEMSVLKKQIFVRGKFLILTPVSIITCALDTIIGLGIGMGALCTVGKHQPTLSAAAHHLHSSQGLLAESYGLFLKAINPKADISSGDDRPRAIGSDGYGFLSNKPIQILTNAVDTYSHSDDFLKRHVFSRSTVALLAISCLVTRAIDGIISVPVASLSILTCGKFASLNNLAFRTLQAPAVIADLFMCTIGIINPRAEI